MNNVRAALEEATKKLAGVELTGYGNGVRFTAANGLTVAVQSDDPLTAAFRRYGSAIGLDKMTVEGILSPCSIFKDLPFKPAYQKGKSETFRFVVNRPSKPKQIAEVALKALSTWEFNQIAIERLNGLKVNLVGQHYRNARDNEVLGWKGVGNIALLVAEPDNPVDLNAVMVLMWDDQKKEWRHVGYVRATQAMLLRGKWTGGHRNVIVARITSKPADGNVELTLTGEMRTYPGYKGV